MILEKIINFYIEGFREMTPRGKKLWVIILIKLFIMFAILKLFFFPDILKTNFKNDAERIQHIEKQLIITKEKQK
jgi:hypothetical protein